MLQGRLLWASGVFLSLYVLLIPQRFVPKILSLRKRSIIYIEGVTEDLVLQLSLSITNETAGRPLLAFAYGA